MTAAIGCGAAPSTLAGPNAGCSLFTHGGAKEMLVKPIFVFTSLGSLTSRLTISAQSLFSSIVELPVLEPERAVCTYARKIWHI
jgi:hypothetical protein